MWHKVLPSAAETARFSSIPCRVFRENVKLVTPLSIRYPDVLVTCAAIDLDTDCVQDADLLVEVLYQSTEPIARTEKAAEYRTLLSLRAYVIVDTNGQTVEAYLRDSPESPWLRTTEPVAIKLHGAQVELA